MIHGVIGIHGKFRLWDDIVHPTQIDMVGAYELEIDCLATKTIPHAITRILEVKIPRGARTVYGLLGVRYFPYSDGNKLKLCIPKETEGAVYSDSLLGAFETTKIGFPQEYMDASIRGVRKSIASNSINLGAGVLEFSYAAFGDVSSSEQIFEKLSFSITSLLSTDLNDVSSDLINELINN